MAKPKLIRVTTIGMALNLLLKGQLKWMSQYFDVLAVSTDDDMLRAVEKREGVRVSGVTMTRQITPLKDIVSLVKMIGLFLKEKPDIVHSHTPKAGLIAMLAAYICRVPNRYHTVAGLPTMTATGLKKKLLDLGEKVVSACATRLFPNSKGVYDHLIAHKLAPKDKLHIIGAGSSNGIDLDHFKLTHELQKEGDDLRYTMSIKQSDTVFLFIGRIVADKGILELLRAFQDLNEPSSHLVLVGPFEDKLDTIGKDAHQTIKSHPRIHSLGFQSDVRAYLAMADIFVFPSHREGFPNVVMQAQAMNVPCIVTDIPGSNELVKSMENGMLTEVKSSNELLESMRDLMESHTLQQTFSNSSRQLLEEKYSQTHVWNELKRIYKSDLERLDVR